MPDPLLYTKAMGAAALCCALLVAAIGGWRRPVPGYRSNLAGIVGMSVGLAFGYYLLNLRIGWPPRNGLDRLLTIVFPAVVFIEGLASWVRVPTRLAWLLRFILAAIVGRVLLHDSVYLREPAGDWGIVPVVAALVVCAVLLAAVWILTWLLAERSPGASIPFALGLATQCTGIVVMLAGYIKGGAAAIPLTAVILTAGLVSKWLYPRASVQGIVGIGVVGLFGLLFVGRFFGRISTIEAVTILLAPLLCWVTEIPALRNQSARVVGTIRILLVAIPLMVVLGFAKRDFDRHMKPLLSVGAKSPRVLDAAAVIRF